jgi:FkbM family methyltransferase
MFLLANPDFDCVSFEPNPALWCHYDGIPTQLIGKAAYIHDGTVEFTVDPVDADGSSLVAGKAVDFHETVDNSECPVLSVPCINLSRFVREAAGRYDEIVLKLDVEGAEYDILETMLAEETLPLVSHLYCEFHDSKIDLEPGRHDRLLKAVNALLPVDHWDALALSFSRPETVKMREKRRAFLIDLIKRYRGMPASRSTFSAP